MCTSCVHSHSSICVEFFSSWCQCLCIHVFMCVHVFAHMCMLMLICVASMLDLFMDAKVKVCPLRVHVYAYMCVCAPMFHVYIMVHLHTWTCVLILWHFWVCITLPTCAFFSAYHSTYMCMLHMLMCVYACISTCVRIFVFLLTHTYTITLHVPHRDIVFCVWNTIETHTCACLEDLHARMHLWKHTLTYVYTCRKMVWCMVRYIEMYVLTTT